MCNQLTVKNLIDKLSTFDPNLEVRIFPDNVFGDGDVSIKAIDVYDGVLAISIEGDITPNE